MSPDDTVTVPPGHAVMVVYPAKKAQLGRGKSGVWIADLGASGDFAEVISRVTQLSAAGQQTSIIWIQEAT